MIMFYDYRLYYHYGVFWFRSFNLKFKATIEFGNISMIQCFGRQGSYSGE